MTTKLTVTEHEVDAILRVVHARSNDEWRPQLTAVQVAGGWAMASDSYRLAAHPIDVDGPPWWLPGEWLPLLPDGADVQVELGDDWQRLHVGRHRFTTNRMKAEPIDWLKLTTRARGELHAGPPPHRITLNRDQLLAAIARPFKGEHMSLVGLASTSVRRVLVAGEECTEVHPDGFADPGWLPPLAFNAPWLRALLRAHADPWVTIEAWSSRSAVVVQEPDDEAGDPSLVQALMPVVGGLPPALTEKLTAPGKAAA
ncbi:MAG TPA: hypothetical protein VFU14_20330 [Acidimicrobiales bacterium]|nr:hypothetical protein [Acidimicrobiales bacterium]